MESTYHKLDMSQNELLQNSSIIEDVAYVLSAGPEKMNYSAAQSGNSKCKSCSSQSPCRATSLEFKVDKK